MALIAPVRLRVDDRSGVAPVRRAAEQMAEDIGFDEVRRGEIAIVVTELATNLLRHAGGGEIVLRVTRGERPTVDAVAVDRGPGITNPVRAMEDGYSTFGGGSGNGLGAIERLSATMDLQTGSAGTVVAARLGADVEVPVVDGIALAMAGETVSVRCPIVYIGTPEGVRLEGGILDQVMHELHIETDPSSIQNHIDVDVSGVKLGKSLHVSDLQLPAGIKVLDDPGATVCVVAVSKAGVEATPTEPTVAEPEVIRKLKPDDEK